MKPERSWPINGELFTCLRLPRCEENKQPLSIKQAGSVSTKVKTESKTFPLALSLAFALSLPPAWCNWSDRNNLLGSVVLSVFLCEVNLRIV